MPVYVAEKPLRVGDEVRPPGALIPEAAEWQNLHFWVDAGFVKEVLTPEESAAKLHELGVEDYPRLKKDGTPARKPGRKAKGAGDGVQGE